MPYDGAYAQMTRRQGEPLPLYGTCGPSGGIGRTRIRERAACPAALTCCMAVRSGRVVACAVFAGLVLVAVASSAAAAAFVPLPDGANEFNSPAFVVRHAWVKFAFVATRPLRGELSRQDEDAKVARFFALNGLIAQRERIAGDPQSNAGSGRGGARGVGGAAVRRRGLKEHGGDDPRRAADARHQGGRADATRRRGRGVATGRYRVQEPPAVLVKSPRSGSEGERVSAAG